jgi:tRNA threonylcarbamoyladenosine biosynthesis protein TsaE
LTFVLPDAAATERAGQALATCVRGGDAIALVGELGAGKTTFVSGVCAALGAGAAHSPSFALVHEYAAQPLTVWHVDLYRLEREAELVELGLDELVGDPRGIVLIEWADRFPVMPPAHVRVDLTHDGEARRMLATGHGRRGGELADAFDRALAAAGFSR